MAKTLLEKMFLKPEYEVALCNLPQQLATEIKLPKNADTSMTGKYHFVLAFYIKEQKLKEDAAKFKESLLQGGLLWIAYPKKKLWERI